MFKMEKGPNVAPPVERAADVAAAPSVEELAAMKNPTDKNFRLAAEKIVETMIEKDPVVRSVLEANTKGSIVDRRTALVDAAVNTLRVRVDGIRKGWADANEVNIAMEKVLAQQVGKFGGMKEAA